MRESAICGQQRHYFHRLPTYWNFTQPTRALRLRCPQFESAAPRRGELNQAPSRRSRGGASDRPASRGGVSSRPASRCFTAVRPPCACPRPERVCLRELRHHQRFVSFAFGRWSGSSSSASSEFGNCQPRSRARSVKPVPTTTLVARAMFGIPIGSSSTSSPEASKADEAYRVPLRNTAGTRCKRMSRMTRRCP